MQYRLRISFIPTCTSKMYIFITIFTLLSLSCAQTLPQGFVYVEEIIPDIAVDLRYYSKENFIGDWYCAEIRHLFRANKRTFPGPSLVNGIMKIVPIHYWNIKEWEQLISYFNLVEDF